MATDKQRAIEAATKALAVLQQNNLPPEFIRLAKQGLAQAQAMPDVAPKRGRPRKVPAHERKRSAARRTKFTELGLKKLGVPEVGQELYWDSGTGAQRGLSVLVSPGGTKTYRATFNLHGRMTSAAIGRVGEIDLGKARETVLAYRKAAAEGRDPRVKTGDDADTFEKLVGEYIRLEAKLKQRTWDQTEQILTKNCAPLLTKKISEITERDVYKLLDGFNADGHPYKTVVTQAALKAFFAWAKKRTYVAVNIMRDVSVTIERRERNRWYKPEEIATTWAAADQLDTEERAFVKLTMLLAPRDTALAMLRRSHLRFEGDTPVLWVTPFELTKSRKTSKKKREYITPLPPLAQRILMGLPKREGDDDRIFPSLKIWTNHKTGASDFDGRMLKKRLVAHGAPGDFKYHAWRHTIATWLENQGHSEWERGLVLNHAHSGTVTAGYSHGYPAELKRKLLEKWADHVEKLVTPERVTLLRG